MDGIINNSHRSRLISLMSNTRDVIQSAQRRHDKHPPIEVKDELIMVKNE